MLTESSVAAASFRAMTDPARNAVEIDESAWKIPGVDTSRRFDPSLSEAERAVRSGTGPPGTYRFGRA
jgi:hypothetical protein